MIFVMYISAVPLQSISPFPSHVRMLMFLPALNLKLSVAPSAPIIANYLLQPQAMCQLACSNQTLLFSRQGCVAHKNGILIAWIFLAVTVFGSKLQRRVRHEGELFRCCCSQVFCQVACLAGNSDTASFLVCVHHMYMCNRPGVALHKKRVLHCISLIFQTLHQPWQEACPWGTAREWKQVFSTSGPWFKSEHCVHV